MSKLLDYTGLGRFLDKLKTLFVTDVGVNGNSLTCTKDGVTSNITIPYATKTQSIPFGVTDDSSTSQAYIATVDGITQLRDGVCCIIRNTKVDGGANAITININGLGAKSLYRSNALSSMEHYTFPKNKTYLLVFSESLDGWIVGRLTDENDNNEAYNIMPYTAALKTKTRQGRYMICLTYNEEYVLPVNDTDNNQTTNKTMTTESFDPFGEVFFGYIGYSTVADNLARGLYIAHSACNLKYSFNITDSTFTINKSVYLVMSPQLDGKCKLHNDPLSQTLPTTEDGLVYKLLGVATSGYQIRLYLHKPCYYFKDGQIREWTNTPTVDISGKADSATTLAGYGITDAKIENGTITLGSNTITPLTQHQTITGKEDNTNKVTSLSSSSTDTQYPSAKCVYDLSNQKQNKIPIVSVASNTSSLSCEEDKYYRLDTAINTFSITLPTVTDVGITKSVIIYLTTSTTPAITITSTQQLRYSHGFSIEASKTYEINALWNGAAWTITSIEL